MSLTLTTTTRMLASLVRTINEDGAVDEAEFQVLRDGSDACAVRLKDIDTYDTSASGGYKVDDFLKATDDLVEILRHMARVAGNARIPPKQLADLKLVVEHQLIYLVAGYQSGLDRCVGS